MKYVIGLAAFTGLALASPAVAEENAEIAKAVAAFQKSNVGTSPQTSGEFAKCGAYWLKWSETVAKDYSKAELALLPPALQPAASKAHYNATIAAAQATLDLTTPDKTAALNKQFTEHYQNAGFTLAMGVLGSDADEFFGVLGSCGRP